MARAEGRGFEEIIAAVAQVAENVEQNRISDEKAMVIFAAGCGKADIMRRVHRTCRQAGKPTGDLVAPVIEIVALQVTEVIQLQPVARVEDIGLLSPLVAHVVIDKHLPTRIARRLARLLDVAPDDGGTHRQLPAGRPAMVELVHGRIAIGTAGPRASPSHQCPWLPSAALARKAKNRVRGRRLGPATRRS